MAVTVTCECGHVTELADSEQLADVRSAHDCSACGRLLTMPVPTGKRMFQQLWQSHVGDEVPTIPPPEASAIEPPVVDEPTPPRRSLWEVMRGSTETSPQALECFGSTKPSIQERLSHDNANTVDQKDASPVVSFETLENASVPEWRAVSSHRTPGSAAVSRSPQEELIPDAVKPRGLWSVMPGATSIAASDMVMPPTQEIVGAVDAPSPKLVPELTLEQKYAQAASLASMTHVAATWQPEPEPEPEPFDDDEREWSLRAVTAEAFALLTMFVAVAGYRPEWWWRGPALFTGLVAVLLGLIATSEVRRSRGRLKGAWLARSSVLIGAFGMFLAPLVFARLGERQRENAGREEIDWRLRRIGQGLDQFHNQQGHFPESAIKGRDAHGDNVPMHGWMTPLLPSLGQDAIYRRIDLKQPFDAPANVAAMQQQIPEFSLPNRKPARSPRGFGLTHFAGVGGQDVREPTGLVHLGLFNDQGPVKREQFTDGLSQTLIVGEIRDRDPPAPPWGEPGNVRSIGDGLNRQFRGFGNANGTGATFLHADGSAKFYSSKTDHRVLQRLETRDGAERE